MLFRDCRSVVEIQKQLVDPHKWYLFCNGNVPATQVDTNLVKDFGKPELAMEWDVLFRDAVACIGFGGIRVSMIQMNLLPPFFGL